MKITGFSLSGSFCGLFLFVQSFQPLQAAAPEAVDRGPTFSGTIRAKFPGDNTAMKGIVVTLGAETNAFICYDTDLMRVSLAWTGDYLKFGNYMKEIVHPQPPEVAGKPVFGTKPGPGWAKAGLLKDPRRNEQGPLPAEWAKYRGLYLNGCDVVFSYTVGKARVLELPGLITHDGEKVFTRTIQLEKPSSETLLVCDGLPASASGIAKGTKGTLTFSGVGTTEATASFGVALIGAPEATLLADGGAVRVKLSGRESAGKSFQIAIWSGKPDDSGKFKAAVATLAAPRDLSALTKGGPARWSEPVVTKGALATSGGDGAYVVDNLAPPVPNPWNANTFIGGFDFFPDGRAAVCTFHGDVWIVSGIDATLDKLTWRRFATGLFQPLGEGRGRQGVCHRPRPDHAAPRFEQRWRGGLLRELQQRHRGDAELPRVQPRSANGSCGKFLLRQRLPVGAGRADAASRHDAESLQGRLEARGVCERLARSEWPGHGAEG